jgi:hypothetical protein
MQNILNLSREPKTLDLERADDGTLRLVITLKKLGQVSAMEYFLDGEDALKLAEALGR